MIDNNCNLCIYHYYCIIMQHRANYTNISEAKHLETKLMQYFTTGMDAACHLDSNK